MTRRARGFGAPSRIGVALLIAALAFAAALMADGGGGINPVFAQTTVDYDDDNDGLIDVRSLAQLDAIRHDLDGNGDPSSGGATAYGIAFPNRVTTSSGRMGCPSGTCSGYELRAHLDFDTDGDGSTYAGTGDSAASDSGDAYHNSGNGWAPIGSGTSRFSATFKGNGFIISNLFIKRASTNWVGLFAALAGSARVESAGVHDGFVHGQNFVGILAGENKGTVAASWTTGAARGAAFIGGLVGYNVNFAAGDAGAVIACYSHASAHSTASSGNANMGGLVGTTQGVTGRPASLVASYSTGAVTAGTTSNVAALTLAVSPATITNSYYDSTTSVSSAGAGAGHATSALQTPTGYTGIYSAWNVNVDGTTGNDDPWDFGTASQYPVLKFGGMDPDLQRAGGDYDLDNDGLIEITTLAQLDAVRHDVDGNGDPTAGAGATAYNAAFPIRIKTAATRMGCPSGTCSGYELAAHLDFDTDGDGSTYDGTGTSATGDSGDAAYYNGGAGWEPIGTATSQFSATFKGNGYIISNLFIKRTAANNIGLFGRASPTARFESVGVDNAYVYGNGRVGGLVGRHAGSVAASYSTGWVRGGPGGVTGGLVGWLASIGGSGRITASYSTAAVSTHNTGFLGGLVGQMAAGTRVSASYSTGTVTTLAPSNVGAFVGGGVFTGGNPARVVASYWDSTTSGRADDADTNPPEGKTTADLKGETGYTGIYANWNVNVDGVSGADDPWDFGTSSQYPALKFGGMNPLYQHGDYDIDDDGLIDVSSLAQLDAVRHDLNGDGDPASAGLTAYAAAFPFREKSSAGRMGCPSGTCSGYELAADLDFDTDGDGVTYTGSGASAAGDSGDAYYNGGAGWLPIGSDPLAANRFAATFKGNGYIIHNLFIKRADTNNIGLFGSLHATARVESLGIANGYAYGNISVGLLVGVNRGTVAACWSGGAVRGKLREIGGLVGYNFAGVGTPNDAGDIIASYSTASAHSERATGQADVGGLAGATRGAAGNTANIIASYSTGAVTAASSTNVSGLTNLSGTASVNRLFLGLHHKRHRRRHGHRHARRRADRRPESPDRLRRHILHVERERGRRRRRRRPVGLRLGRRLPDAEIRRHGPVDSARRLRPRQRRLDRNRRPRPARRRPPRPERQRRRDQRQLRRRLPPARHRVRDAHGLPVGSLYGLRAHRRPRLRYGRRRRHLHRNGRVRRGRPRRRLLQRRRGLRPDWQRQRQPLHLDVQGQRTYHLQPVHEAPDHERHGAVRRAGRRSPRRKRGRQGRLRQRLQLDGHPRRHVPWDGRRLLEQRRGLWSRASRRAGWLASHRANNSQLLPRGDDRDGGIQQRLHRGRLGGGNKLDHAQRPRHRQLLHWNRRRHGRGPGGESQRLDGRLRRRRRNRVLLGHHRERHPGRRRRDHARRALDHRAANPNRLRRRLRRLERRRGRRSRRR